MKGQWIESHPTDMRVEVDQGISNPKISESNSSDI
jgi:hypothetical protein